MISYQLGETTLKLINHYMPILVSDKFAESKLDLSDLARYALNMQFTDLHIVLVVHIKL